MTVTGTASGSASTTTTVNFTVSATNQSFTFTSNLGASGQGAISVKQGAPATVNLTANSSNGFVITGTGGNPMTTVPLTYSSSESPSVPLSNLTFSPVSPSQSPTVSVQITTTASTIAQALPLNDGKRILYAALLPGFLGIAFMGGSRRRSLRGMRMLGLVLVVAASMLWLGSCGGSNNSSTGTQGTPPGNYAITINASTGGPAPLKASYKFTLTVTQ